MLYFNLPFNYLILNCNTVVLIIVTLLNQIAFFNQIVTFLSKFAFNLV